MASWTAEVRRVETAMRRELREEAKRQKALEKRRREAEKLDAQQRARLEVESYENELALLLSVHREVAATVDWHALAAALPPHDPPRLARHELQAVFARSLAPSAPSLAESELSADDRRDHATAIGRVTAEHEQWKADRDLARRVLAGDGAAYGAALARFSPFAEIAQLGTAMAFVAHGRSLVEARLTVNGRCAIPAEVKALTAAGKLTTKGMPKGRFHEIYQDYVCGSLLRVARELFALLPVRTVIATALVHEIDAATGRDIELPVLSVCFPRERLETLRFDELDPSDSMSNFLHRGDVLASRKTGRFTPVEPLAPADVAAPGGDDARTLDDLLVRVGAARAAVGAQLKKLP